MTTNADPFEDNEPEYATTKEAKEAIRSDRKAKKDAEAKAMKGEDWEEISTDNGELVAWHSEGEYIQGTYVGPVEIELPPEQQKVIDGVVQTIAVIHVFETVNGRESCWDTWQLRDIMGVKWQIGQYGRIEYVGSRKAKQGNVKRFKVLVRKAQ